jgi:uncharacterized protein (TIGR02996 family)
LFAGACSEILPDMPEAAALHRAGLALDEGDTGRARTALLEAWRTGRSAVVADLIGLLDARQPDALPAQLAAVLTPRVSTTLERFTPLLRIDDPRVSAFALAQLERLPFTTPGAQPLLESFLRVVLERRDVRLLAAAKTIREGLRTRLTRAPVRDALLAELDHAVTTLKRLEPTSTPAARALTDGLRARLASLAAPAQSEEALLAAIYERPFEDGSRLVYADWLLERGDPRGEFITLQFKRRAGGLTEAEGKREAALLKKHGRQWLGALAPVCSFGKGYARTTFERGFLCRADIILSVGKKLEPLWRASEWRTVEALDGSWPLELLEKAPLTALRGIDRPLTVETLTALQRGRLKLGAEAIELNADVRDWALVRSVFPHVRAVSVWWRGTPSVALLQQFAALGLQRLEFRRTWDSPRGADVDAEFASLLEALKSTRLTVTELALMPGWGAERARPALVELRPSGSGFAPS